MTDQEARDEHDCETCAECLHDGHKCCGCYDGVCCQPTDQEARDDADQEAHAALNGAIDEVARTTTLSRDQATTIAMNYPHADFLRFYAANHGQLGRYGLDYAWSVYANPTATRIEGAELA